MQIEKYDRKPFSVLAVQVTFKNVLEVAEWCKGTVITQKTKMLGVETEIPAIRVEGQGDNRGKSFVATLGCYVVELKGSFRVYKPAQFDSSFQVTADPMEDLLTCGDPIDLTNVSKHDCLEDGSCCRGDQPLNKNYSTNISLLDNSSVDGQETAQIA